MSCLYSIPQSSWVGGASLFGTDPFSSGGGGGGSGTSGGVGGGPSAATPTDPFTSDPFMEDPFGTKGSGGGEDSNPFGTDTSDAFGTKGWSDSKVGNHSPFLSSHTPHTHTHSLTPTHTHTHTLIHSLTHTHRTHYPSLPRLPDTFKRNTYTLYTYTLRHFVPICPSAAAVHTHIMNCVPITTYIVYSTFSMCVCVSSVCHKYIGVRLCIVRSYLICDLNVYVHVS